MPTGTQRLPFKKIRAQIPALDEMDFDVRDIDDFITTKYLIECKNLAGDELYSAELIATKISNDVSDQLYLRFKSNLSIEVKYLKVSTDTLLRITNNETSAVDVSILKQSI